MKLKKSILAAFAGMMLATSSNAGTPFPNCVNPLNPEACRTCACCQTACNGNCAGSALSQCLLACSERHSNC